MYNFPKTAQDVDRDFPQERMKFDKSLFDKYNGPDGLKFFLIVMALHNHLFYNMQIKITLGDIIRDCGHSIDYHRGANVKYKEMLQEIISGYDMVSNVTNWDSLKVGDEIIIAVPRNCVLFNPKGFYVILTRAEYTKIVREHKNVSTEIAVGVYLYIKGLINTTTGTPAYPRISSICDHLGLSKNSVKSAITSLRNIHILFADHYYVVNNNGTVFNTINVYAINPSMLRDKDRVASLLSAKMYHNRKLVVSNDMKWKIDSGSIGTGEVFDISTSNMIRANLSTGAEMPQKPYCDSFDANNGNDTHEEFDDVEYTENDLEDEIFMYDHVSNMTYDPFGINKKINDGFYNADLPTPDVIERFEAMQAQCNEIQRQRTREKVEKYRKWYGYDKDNDDSGTNDETTNAVPNALTDD